VRQPTWVSRVERGARVLATDASAGAGARCGTRGVGQDVDAGAAHVSEPRHDVRALGVPLKKDSGGTGVAARDRLVSYLTRFFVFDLTIIA
jgi:hypothetical protein